MVEEMDQYSTGDNTAYASKLVQMNWGCEACGMIHRKKVRMVRNVSISGSWLFCCPPLLS